MTTTCAKPSVSSSDTLRATSRTVEAPMPRSNMTAMPITVMAMT